MTFVLSNEKNQNESFGFCIDNDNQIYDSRRLTKNFLFLKLFLSNKYALADFNVESTETIIFLLAVKCIRVSIEF